MKEVVRSRDTPQLLHVSALLAVYLIGVKPVFKQAAFIGVVYVEEEGFYNQKIFNRRRIILAPHQKAAAGRSVDNHGRQFCLTYYHQLVILLILISDNIWG